MFESIEIRRVENGFVLVVTTEDDTKEYVYDTSRKALRVIKEYLESKESIYQCNLCCEFCCAREFRIKI